MSVSRNIVEIILSHSSLQQCFITLRFVGSFYAQNISWGPARASNLWLGHRNKLIVSFFFSHSFINFLLCLGSSSCCMTQITPSLSCWTLGLTFDYTKIDIWHTKFQIHWLQGVHILWLLKKPKSSPRCLQLIWGVCADVLCRELLHICICCIWSAFMSKCQTLWFFSKKSNFEALTNFLFVIHVGLTFDTSRQCCRYDACKWKLSRKNTANKNGLFFYGLLYFHIDFIVVSYFLAHISDIAFP